VRPGPATGWVSPGGGRPPGRYVAAGAALILVLGVVGSLSGCGNDRASSAASTSSVSGVLATEPSSTGEPTSEPVPLASPGVESATPVPATAVPAPTPKPAPTPIVRDTAVGVATSHKFSGQKQTYAWTQVALDFDKAVYKVTGVAPRSKSCSIKWSMSDGIDRDGFTLKIAAVGSKTNSQIYKSAVTDGAMRVVSTCKSWSVTVREYIPPKPKTGVYGNPWGYDFNPGARITNPPAAFCSYFDCIPSFWDSINGYVVQCRDGMFSHSGGRQGVCSYHGGYRRTLFRH
jgi:hypothetical protein